MLQTRVAYASFIACVLLIAFGVFEGNIRVETVQPNGLPEISYPYSAISFFAEIACAFLLLFGTMLLFASHRGRASDVRQFLGSILVSAGVTTIYFASFVFLANVLDEGPR